MNDDFLWHDIRAVLSCCDHSPEICAVFTWGRRRESLIVNILQELSTQTTSGCAFARHVIKQYLHKTKSDAIVDFSSLYRKTIFVTTTLAMV